MFNETQVDKTLKVLLDILKKNGIEYRMLGSVVTAAINGGLHRRLGDIDLIVDAEKKDVLFKELCAVGFRQEGGMFAFSRKFLALETLVHDKLLSIGYFWGRFEKSGEFRMGGRLAYAEVQSRTIKAEHYALNGVEFVGLNERAIATGIMLSAQNPKRKKEVELMKEKKIEAYSSEGIKIRMFGLPFSWLYTGAMAFLRLLGKMRVKRGLPFDPWRSKIS